MSGHDQGARGPYALGRGALLRRASGADLDAILAVRRGLALPDDPRAQTDSFLLGSDAQTYAQMLDRARVWALEVEGRVHGFTVTLDDALLRATSLWSEREAITWRPGSEPALLERCRVAYFDQLAVLPERRQRVWSACLAVCALSELVADEGHELVLATTVVEPALNRRALPYLAHLGARELGHVRERYPEVGEIVSVLHAVESAGYWRYAEALTSQTRPDFDAILLGFARAERTRDALLQNP